MKTARTKKPIAPVEIVEVKPSVPVRLGMFLGWAAATVTNAVEAVSDGVTRTAHTAVESYSKNRQ